MTQILESAQLPTQSAATKTIEQAIHEAIALARSACNEKGGTSNECAVAWDIVEELQAEKSHRQPETIRHSFDRYCEDNPEADECRIYDI
jgi:hypothetical protein